MSGLATHIGNRGETAAVEWLRERGYYIVERNWRAGSYEIDIIAQHFDTMHFVEVKTRSFENEGEAIARPALAVNAEKRRRTVEAAFGYLRAHSTHLVPRARPRQPPRFAHLHRSFYWMRRLVRFGHHLTCDQPPPQFLIHQDGSLRWRQLQGHAEFGNEVVLGLGSGKSKLHTSLSSLN